MIKSAVFTRGTLRQPLLYVQYMDGTVECRELTRHEIALRMRELAELLVDSSVAEK